MSRKDSLLENLGGFTAWQQRRPFRSVCILLACLNLSVFLPAEKIRLPIAGRNVNMVSGTRLPGGDPFLQRQNEPSIAVSTRNPLHLLAGANDYRTVDMPGLPEDRPTGDAWLGLFKSFDGGQSWQSTLLPGYLQDQSAAGWSSPLKVFDAAADPVIRAGAHGLFFYSGIAFNRGDRARGVLFVSRLIDLNNKEGASFDVENNLDPIKYLDTTILDRGNPGQFIDKPWLAVDVPRNSARTVTLQVPEDAPDGPRIRQTLPCGNVYVAYTTFVGEIGKNARNRVLLTRSVDCGQTWEHPVKLSEGIPVNQGTVVAVAPNSGHVYVAWRQFKRVSQNARTVLDPDAILVARSEDFGRTFTKAFEVARVQPFDQPTLPVPTSPFDLARSFRSNDFPTMAVDENGRVYLAWTEIESGGRARIVLSHSADGQTWSAPAAVDGSPLPGHDFMPPHQIMPSLSFAGGKLVLTYYDFRDNVFQFVDPGSRLIRDFLDPLGQLFEKSGMPRYPVLEPNMKSGYPGSYLPLHTVDLRVTLAEHGPDLAFGPSTRISRYFVRTVPNPFKTKQLVLEQLQFNPPNLPLFSRGTRPFIGDYVDVTASPALVRDSDGQWRHNTAAAGTVFHTVWTDNRDVRPPADGDWTSYTPPVSDQPEKFKSAVPCLPDKTGMRNQNVYTSRITTGLAVNVLGNSKPLLRPSGVPIQRSFVVVVQNSTVQTRSFRLTLQPASGVEASFLQFEPLPQLDLTVASFSSVARSVFVRCTGACADALPPVRVNVSEIDQPGGTVIAGGLQGSAFINPDPTNPALLNPALLNTELHNPALLNRELTDPALLNPALLNSDVPNPALLNPALLNPALFNPALLNPALLNPALFNPALLNPALLNEGLENPALLNPALLNPALLNPALFNPALLNGSLTDITWTTKNIGNTVSAYSFRALTATAPPQGFQFQLLVYRLSTTPGAVGCELQQMFQQELLINIINPALLNPALLNPALLNRELTDPALLNADLTNATFALAPDDTARITLRVLDPDKTDAVKFNPDQVVASVVAQSVNTDDAERGITQPPAALIITTTSLSDATSGTTYSTTLQAVGGVGDRTWSLDSGALAPGLVLNSAGVISGTPTAAGTFKFRVRVTDSGSPPQFDTRDLAIVVRGPGPKTFTVSNTNDSGAGSLRQAILDANANSGFTDTIVFNIPGTGPRTIAPTSPLPRILDPVIIDGTTQPGYSGTPLVELDGTSAGAAPGLVIIAGKSTVRGLVVNRFQGDAGIELALGGDNLIEGNFIGTDPTGTAARPNVNGIFIIQSQTNTIGGTTPGARNVISGNLIMGVSITGFKSTSIGNVMRGNFIGTTASGTAALGNGGGVALYGEVQTTHIGGTTAEARNVISGNRDYGIQIGNNSNNNLVQGNYIGTDVTGTTGLGNSTASPGGGAGVHIGNSHNNVIGGTASGAGNLISANQSFGLRITSAGAVATGNLVQGNLIGTNADGTAALANTFGGILITGSIVSGSTGGSLIGGSVKGARNIISGNASHGVNIIAPNNVVQGNYIGTNAAGTSALPNALHGVFMQDAPNNIIGGTTAGAANVISGNTGSGISITGSAASGNLIQGNFIGTNAGGNAALGNGFPRSSLLAQVGIHIDGSPGNTVGGTVVGARNLISGNREAGVFIAGSRASGNMIQGNFIGTDITGTTALANTLGVWLFGVPDAVIGGTAVGAGNVISGNGALGVGLGNGSAGALVQGNLIGTDAAGTAALGNGHVGPPGPGVQIVFSQNNTIGGTVTGARNVISGNIGNGIQIFEAFSSGNVVRGNFIGTNSWGTGALPNGLAGVAMSAPNNTIGGTATGTAQNVIAFNGWAGIVVGAGNGNLLRFNQLHTNGGLGIDLGGNGVTANDGGDADTGPNDLQNFPVLSSVTSSGGTTTVQGSLNSTANTPFVIDFFNSPNCDPSGHGEGKTWFGSVTQSTDANGNLSFNASFGFGLAVGTVVTALATSPGNSTSEFSTCVTVTAPPSTTFLSTFGTTANERIYSVVAASGRYVLAGDLITGAGDGDVWLMRIDASGTPLWQRRFGGAANDGSALDPFFNGRLGFVKAVATSDGGFAIAATTESFGSGGQNAYVIKLDGNVIWQQAYGTANSDWVKIDDPEFFRAPLISKAPILEITRSASRGTLTLRPATSPTFIGSPRAT